MADRETRPRRVLKIARSMGVLLVVFIAFLYGKVRGQASSQWLPMLATGRSTHLESGITGGLVVARPTGKTAFSVTFPEPFKAPPRVLLTVIGDSDTQVDARLLGPASLTGFQAIASTNYFIHNSSSNVTVQWLAIGD